MKNKRLYEIDIKPEKNGKIICQTATGLKILEYNENTDWDNLCLENLIFSWTNYEKQNITITLTAEDYCLLSNLALKEKRTLSNMCQVILNKYLEG